MKLHSEWIYHIFFFRIKPEFSEEELAEHARIAKQYTVESFRRTNEINRDLSNKIWLQQEALRALPDHLLEHAYSAEGISVPPQRLMPMYYTPPVKDFDIRKYISTSSSSETEE
jgi:hypothetical protein